MEKQIIGNYFIDNTTIITDNKTHLQYQVIETSNKGIKQKLITTISESHESFLDYDRLEKGFTEGHITISGYEISDGKILHLVINNLKNPPKKSPPVYKQLKKSGLVAIKKKVKKYRPTLVF